MTISVVVKVYDGLVLATDSATTIHLADGSAQVYDFANKTFQLHRQHPIGAMTWGLGAIEGASISTITKDLRRRLMGDSPAHPAWEVDDESYTIEEVVGRAIELFHTELYAPTFSVEGPDEHGNYPTLGLLIAGYSSGSQQAEVWKIEIDTPDSAPTPVEEFSSRDSGWAAFGQPGALMRLFHGVDPFLAGYLASAATVKPINEQTAPLEQVLTAIYEQPAVPPMPFQDAINLAQFMVDTTVGYTRYILGPNTVGGEVEVAGISRHEGFKWVKRKHYFSQSLNPTGAKRES